jgi:hypothetical protein
LLNRFDQIEMKGFATIVLSTASGGQLPADFPAKLNATLTTREKFDELLINKVAKLRGAIMAEATTNVPGAIPGF